MKAKIALFVSTFLLGLGLTPVSLEAEENFVNLHNFSLEPNDGRVPGAVIIEGNLLFGATFFGGRSDNGTVFKVNIDGTGYTKIHEFSAFSNAGVNQDGANPGGAYVVNSTLVLSGSTLYGTTFSGGRFAKGTVFKVNLDGTGFANLHDFKAVEGTSPNAGLILSEDTLYGVTTGGGAADLGTVFKVTTNGTDFVVLHEFGQSAAIGSYTNSDGGKPIGGLLIFENKLYGTAQVGGSNGGGTLFAVNTDGTGFINLHNFAASGPDVNPSGSVSLSGTTLYGTAAAAVFALNLDGSGYTNLFVFAPTSSSPDQTNATGTSPFGGLILSGSTLYGTASGGGSSGNGTVFSMGTNGLGFATLFNFPAVSGQSPHLTNKDGIIPSGGLVLSDNSLYGTANLGGVSGYGTVFGLSLPSPPALTIAPSQGNALLSWPKNAGGLTLQSTLNLSLSSSWKTVEAAPVLVNDQNTVAIPVSDFHRFYRLVR